MRFPQLHVKRSMGRIEKREGEGGEGGQEKEQNKGNGWVCRGPSLPVTMELHWRMQIHSRYHDDGGLRWRVSGAILGGGRGEKGGEVAFSGVIVLAWAACCCRRVTHCASASHVRPTGENDLDHFFLGPSHTMHRRFSSAASATIQNSAAPPSVRGLCGSAAHS